MRNDFTKDEIVMFERYNKKLKRNVITKFPVVGGRLRLYHEEVADKNYQSAGIACKIFKYEDNVAVVQASATLNGSVFTGIGMSSKSRDGLIYPAILEMAETRAIARALRFAGFGVEYTGAEEMQSVKDFPKESTDTDPEGPALKKAEKITEKDPEPAEKDDDQKLPDTINDDEKSLKRRVWEIASEEFQNIAGGDLGEHLKDFISKTLSKYEDGTKDSVVFEAIIGHQDEFIRAFTRQIDQGKKKSEPKPETKSEPTEDMKDSYREATKKAIEAKTVKKEEPEVDTAARKSKARILMMLPDGTNVNALNGTLEALLETNADKKPEEIYEIILQDIETFTKVLVAHCEEHELDTGFGKKDEKKTEDPDKRIPDPGKKIPEPAEEGDSPDTDKDDKDEYSDFRKQWANLRWKEFNLFIIQQARVFKNNQAEYDAAVDKYNRLKIKNDAENMCFPYMMDKDYETTPGISTENSVLETRNDGWDQKLNTGTTVGRVQDLSLLKQYIADYPKMCKRVENATGISRKSEDDDSVSSFLDEFEHQVTTWEKKNEKAYKE